MAKDADKTKNINVDEYGEVRIADDVVGNIAGIAATEIEGVAGTVGNMTKELMSRMGLRTQSKGVKVVIDSGVVTVDLALIMKYGYNIPITSKHVQERVKTSIENMTGLKVSNVGIRIVGIDMSNEE
ncbi:MAG: Asp23/Gls24 family envelope stress response protein [Lachnospiraceae bacterium]|nr:Asp23/Gls24 family envelope stress response protein [Lachnospiraceae bacterium]